MQISYSPVGSVDIWRPNRGLEQLVSAGIKSTILDFSVICQVYDPKEVMRIEKSGRRPKGWIFREQPEQITESIRMFVTKCKELHVDITLAIMPYFKSEQEAQKLQELYPLLRECMKACHVYGIEKVVIQPLQADWETNLIFYQKLLGWAKEDDLHILLKNCLKYLNGRYVRGTCSDAEEANTWIETLNELAEEERFGFCMDMGVCSICGQNMYEFATVLGRKIEAVLINENNGQRPGAMLPFSQISRSRCRTDWLNFFRGLRAAAFQGTAILDVRESLAASPLLLREGMLQHTKRIGEYLRLQLELEQMLAKYDKRVLFGAGNMCRNYMKCYGEKYPPLFTCDNNAAIWGTRFEGLEVKAPEELKKLPEDCAIFICNIYYDEIKKQLQKMGLQNPIHYFNDEFMPSLYLDRFDSEIREVY